ncbi:MAG: hypothetical protein QM724_03460 [Flavobacteriales bacterium]
MPNQEKRQLEQRHTKREKADRLAFRNLMAPEHPVEALVEEGGGQPLVIAQAIIRLLEEIIQVPFMDGPSGMEGQDEHQKEEEPFQQMAIRLLALKARDIPGLCHDRLVFSGRSHFY